MSEHKQSTSIGPFPRTLLLLFFHVAQEVLRKLRRQVFPLLVQIYHHRNVGAPRRQLDAGLWLLGEHLELCCEACVVLRQVVLQKIGWMLPVG